MRGRRSHHGHEREEARGEEAVTLTYSPLTAAGPLVELTDIKLYLRVDSDAEDTLIQSLILSAGTEAEHITHRVLARRDYLVTCGGGITEPVTLPLVPCSSVSILTDAAGTSEVDASLYSIGHTSSRPAGDADIVTVVPGDGFPAGTIWIRAACGYTDVPEPVRQWVRVRVATLYEQRENFTIGSNFQEFSHNFADSLLDDYVIHGGF